ncbi:N-acetyltransferase [Pedobacter sp. HMWF019]|uniref:GNAT family N-acetyltransferase n=1 Tax=Pedobacter sp. HMWF019 TaxID=2056856 RepID=UPI000D337F48|nr:GNAT family N-acetyltransferase [Pedobacter sp. HMWF019]PTS95802.1 N-acetyltransferase [Pedobacter sp. HMWF019]
MQRIRYRELAEKELYLLARIDRSEKIFTSYQYRDGELVLIDTSISAGRFNPLELEEMIKNQRELINAEGKVIGAFENKKIIGAASVDRRKRGRNKDYCKMDILYVSKNFRANKVGQMLLQKCKGIAKEFGASKLYISATPTKGTVDFYLNNSAVLVEELDEELFKIEPDDIHLEIKL